MTIAFTVVACGPESDCQSSGQEAFEGPTQSGHPELRGPPTGVSDTDQGSDDRTWVSFRWNEAA